MTDHVHSDFVPGCYRCDLSRDEERSALERERHLTRELVAHMAERIYRGGPRNWLDFVSTDMRETYEDLTSTE